MNDARSITVYVARYGLSDAAADIDFINVELRIPISKASVLRPLGASNNAQALQIPTTVRDLVLLIREEAMANGSNGGPIRNASTIVSDVYVPDTCLPDEARRLLFGGSIDSSSSPVGTSQLIRIPRRYYDDPLESWGIKDCVQVSIAGCENEGEDEGDAEEEEEEEEEDPSHAAALAAMQTDAIQSLLDALTCAVLSNSAHTAREIGYAKACLETLEGDLESEMRGGPQQQQLICVCSGSRGEGSNISSSSPNVMFSAFSRRCEFCGGGRADDQAPSEAPSPTITPPHSGSGCIPRHPQMPDGKAVAGAWAFCSCYVDMMVPAVLRFSHAPSNDACIIGGESAFSETTPPPASARQASTRRVAGGGIRRSIGGFRLGGGRLQNSDSDTDADFAEHTADAAEDVDVRGQNEAAEGGVVPAAPPMVLASVTPYDFAFDQQHQQQQQRMAMPHALQRPVTLLHPLTNPRSTFVFNRAHIRRGQTCLIVFEVPFLAGAGEGKEERVAQFGVGFAPASVVRQAASDGLGRGNGEEGGALRPPPSSARRAPDTATETNAEPSQHTAADGIANNSIASGAGGDVLAAYAVAQFHRQLQHRSATRGATVGGALPRHRNFCECVWLPPRGGGIRWGVANRPTLLFATHGLRRGVRHLRAAHLWPE